MATAAAQAVSVQRQRNKKKRQILRQAKTLKTNDSGEWNGIKFGYSSMQGVRPEMEDAHCAVTDLEGCAFFGVFDGHAGAEVSEHCADHLLDSILNNYKLYRMADDAEPLSASRIKAGIRKGFVDLDSKMLKHPKIKNGGSTALCAMITRDRIFIANCGDSKAVLSRNGTVAFATIEHSASDPREQKRVEECGGFIERNRVNGVLAPSRALGDFKCKNIDGQPLSQQPVSNVPVVSVHDRSSEDEFLVLACDGVWDVMQDQEVVSLVRQALTKSSDLKAVCNLVADTSLKKGSMDNISVMIILFPQGGSLSEASESEEEVVQQKDNKKLSKVMQCLSSARRSKSKSPDRKSKPKSD